MTPAADRAQKRYKERNRELLREKARARGRKFRKENPEAEKANCKRFRQSRRQLVDGLKNKPCMDCHNSFPPECMDFDHVRGVKDTGIYQMYTKSLDRLMAEIDKCDLVCANCHRIRTKARNWHKGEKNDSKNSTIQNKG